MTNFRTKLGISFIIAGSTFLVIIIVWLFWLNGSDLFRLFSSAGPSYSDFQRNRPMIEAPVPTGSSELSDFYAKNPPTAYRKKNKGDFPEEPIEKPEEDRIDSSLWMSEYYTNPEGFTWNKDSNSKNILSETKQGENQFNTNVDGLNGDSLQSPTPAKPLHVEFWNSPVNYKGYRLNGNNLILFGINPDDSLRFERHPDGIWMHHKNRIFLLHPCNDFMPFTERAAETESQQAGDTSSSDMEEVFIQNAS